MPRTSIASLTVLLSLVLAAATPGRAQPVERDLLARFTPAEQVVSGMWAKTDAGLRGTSDVGAICVLPGEVADAYTLTVAFTRTDGDDVIALLLPIGERRTVLELSGWRGEAHGLARLEGRTSRDTANPTSVRPGVLLNGTRHRAVVNVGERDGQPSITATLDGKRLFSWTGPASRLDPHLFFKLPDTAAAAIALGTVKSTVVFHSATLRNKAKPAGDRDTTLVAPAPIATRDDDAGTIDTINLASLTEPNTPGWEPFNGARFTAGADRGDPVVSSVVDAGGRDRGAFLRGVTFADGVIDVELRGANQRGRSFLGVVFHAVDGETYDAVYFRPFNFKAANELNRSHGVQYIAHPRWTWRRLRDERTGQFEKAATPEPDPADRFRAKIEVKAGRVRVFVNDSDTPCLDVPKLNDRRSGKVGVWFNGVATFAALRVTPDED